MKKFALIAVALIGLSLLGNEAEAGLFRSRCRVVTRSHSCGCTTTTKTVTSSTGPDCGCGIPKMSRPDVSVPPATPSKKTPIKKK